MNSTSAVFATRKLELASNAAKKTAMNIFMLCAEEAETFQCTLAQLASKKKKTKPKNEHLITIIIITKLISKTQTTATITQTTMEILLKVTI